MTDKLTNEIYAIYCLNGVGGPLHIVLDDGNLSDTHITYCLNSCRDHWSALDHPELIPLTLSVGKQLLDMRLEERQRLYTSAWNNARRMSLTEETP